MVRCEVESVCRRIEKISLRKFEILREEEATHLENSGFDVGVSIDSVDLIFVEIGQSYGSDAAIANCHLHLLPRIHVVRVAVHDFTVSVTRELFTIFL